ncbi:uncharacterized protein A4U43_C03F9660 [Asparagus officinalis]|uniref:Bifunctional inhibitor/plant lipid transfer protein/seed storage helical domain-containing protein n=1 Tax=Asparagus officinalis TaxID=4686 RepID=A0A5P1FD00_ASPOF|nr:uncharacterized protein A4U43_C03F9660 [Asparagus officinalis]
MSPQSFLWILFFVLLHSTSTPNLPRAGRELMQAGADTQSLHVPLLPEARPATSAAPEECCAQLRQVREGCRCRGIREMVQEVKWEEGFRGRECRGRCGEMLMRGKLLPAMCSVEPHRCEMRQGVGYDDDE